MKTLISLFLFSAFLPATAAFGQEADSGFELRTNLSADTSYSQLLAQPPRDGSDVTGGVRAMLYPTWKLNSHWSVSGAVQLISRPYFPETFNTQGYGVSGSILQLNLSYARFWSGNRSVVVRVGQLSSVFGSFLQRYDSTENTVIGMPLAYGYYYKPVSIYGLTGAQVEGTVGKLDARAQFANSSPANPRSFTDHDQYGNWAGGVGYTLRQGLRIGASTYYGPYLDRQYAFFFPGEANPNLLPAFAYGADIEWGWRHWNAWGEWQHFHMDYRLLPMFTLHTGYGEVRRVLSPRWYLATRIGYMRAGEGPATESYEFAAGFRPSARQLVKFGYTIQQGPAFPGTLGNVAAVEYVTSLPTLSFAKN